VCGCKLDSVSSGQCVVVGNEPFGHHKRKKRMLHVACAEEIRNKVINVPTTF
jgi:hypothetical protein